MSFLGDIADFLIGGKSKKADFKQIERLMRLSEELNRTNRHGFVTNWDWQEGPDGTPTQVMSLNPQFQGAADRLMGRASGQGMEAYKSPEQFSTLLNAAMANQMQRRGLLEEMPQLQGQFGQLAQNRAGLFPSTSLPQPPPAVPPEEPPIAGRPGNPSRPNPGMPPGGGRGGGIGGPRNQLHRAFGARGMM